MSAPRGFRRDQVPAPGPVRPFSFPELHAFQTSNGLRVRVARMSRLPLVTIGLILDAGEGLLPVREAGWAALTGSSLEGGTRRRTGPELAEALEGIGARISLSTGWDATSVTLTCMAERLPAAMSLLAEAAMEPAFPEDEVQRLRDQKLATIRQRRMDPRSLANDSSARFIYAEDCPYGRPLGGLPSSVEAFGVEEARSHSRRRYCPNTAGLILVGDLELPEVEAMADEVFGPWQPRSVQGDGFAAPSNLEGGRVAVVDRPGAVQSEIRIGQVGVPRSTSLFFPLKVFNAVLGGAFTSRLMLNLREKQGFTYGVRSGFSFRRQAGPFTISTAVATEVTAPAVQEAMSELTHLLEGGPTEEEASRARDFIAGVFPLRFETTGQVASRLGELFVYDLPEDFFSTYRDRIREVTPETAIDAGRTVLDPSRMVVTVVGDAEKVRGPLEELPFGPVEVATPFY